MTQHLTTAAGVLALAIGSFAAPVFVAPAPAQEQSVEEMAERFKKQKTRGLSIATPTNNTATDTSTQTTTTTPTEVAATAVPKEEQVNVNISFDFDSAALREDQKPKLVALCSALKAADVQKIRILGHTDASGSEAYNERLSRLRAEEVKRFLTSDCGYPADRMEATGVGERYLFDTSDPRGDVNRRVEFQALG
ncbi:MAG: OmpA family protein [Pseudomonadota bacterium]